MAKKKKGDEQQQPRVSPYTDSPVSLYVGPERKTYYVPKHLLLQNSGRITASLSQWSSSVYLPDIDTSTGHVLAHYLYTGAYQTLDNVETSLVKVHIEFKKAFVVYKVAKTYEISGLQQLAMDEIKQYDKAMTIFNVTEAIDENFSTLTGDTDWFQEYLIGKFSRAFQEDFTIFATSSFFDSISNADLYKFAVKCAVELYSNKISRLLCLEQRETVLEHRGAVAGDGGDGGDGGDEKREEDDWGGGWGAATTKKKKGKKSKKDEEEEEKRRKEEEEEAERKKKEEEEEDPCAFSFGAGAGTTTAKGKKKKKGTLIEPEPEPEPEPPKEPEPEPVKEPEPEPAPEPPVDPFKGLSKSQKKKLEQKMKKEAEAKAKEEEEQKKKDEEEAKRKEEEEAAAAAAAAAEPAKADGWGDDWGTTATTSKSKKKDKKAKKGAVVVVPEPEPEPVVEDAPVQEPDGVEEPKAEDEDEWVTPSWGKKTKKNNGPVDVTEEAPTAPVQKPDEDDPWGSAQFNIGKKSKKGKKGSALNPPLAPTPPTEVNLLDDVELPPPKAIEAPSAEEEDDAWGFASSSKKKKRGEKDELANDGGKLSKLTTKDSASKAVDDLKYVKADGVVCPDQAKHLLEARMWKNCRLCQGFLCQVANQIAFIIQPMSEVEAGPVEKDT